MISNYRSLPILERYNLWRLYQNAYPEFSYSEMINHFNDNNKTVKEDSNNSIPPNERQLYSDSLYSYNKAKRIWDENKVDAFGVGTSLYPSDYDKASKFARNIDKKYVLHYPYSDSPNTYYPDIETLRNYKIGATKILDSDYIDIPIFKKPTGNALPKPIEKISPIQYKSNNQIPPSLDKLPERNLMQLKLKTRADINLGFLASGHPEQYIGYYVDDDNKVVHLTGQQLLNMKDDAIPFLQSLEESNGTNLTEPYKKILSKFYSNNSE